MSTILPHMVHVALVQIKDASLKRSARGSLKYRTQKSPKIRHLRTIAQLCQAISSQLRHLSTIGKILLNSNTSVTCPHNMVNFGRRLRSVREFGEPLQISTSFASWGRYCTTLY